MRKKIVAGNWKMNCNLEEGISLAREILRKVNFVEGKEMILCPPFIHLNSIVEICRNFKLYVGAQNCSSEEKGAYTGEVSAAMIASCGAKYVIIGHSERRSYFNENNQLLKKKVLIAQKNGLIPIYCCGETLKEREEGKLFDVVKEQIVEGLFHLDSKDFQNIVIAYEPVWAIGTGVNATAEQAQEMHEFIRNLIKEKYGENIANNTTILYGGSCNSKNSPELFACSDVDGGLIGGASLKADEFIAIYNSL